jgi:hypothetical protein
MSTSRIVRRIIELPPEPEAMSPYGRSRVSNGYTYHQKIDGRSQIARRTRDLIAQFEFAVGPDRLDEATRQTIRRCAQICCSCEVAEGKVASDIRINFDSYLKAARLASRLLREIGIDRRSKIALGERPVDADNLYDPLRAYLQSELGPNGRLRRNARIERAITRPRLARDRTTGPDTERKGP